MADFFSTWTLKIKDLMSGPIQSSNKIVSAMSRAVENLESTSNKAFKELSSNLKDEQDRRKELIKAIKEQEEELRKNTKTVESGNAAWNEYMEAKSAIDRNKEALERLNEELRQSNEDVEELSGRLQSFGKEGMLGGAVLRFNQLSDIVDKVAQSLQFVGVYDGISDNIEMMTGAQGKALEQMSATAYKMSKVFEVSGEEIARTANATAQRFGIPFEAALEKIQEGMEKGANVSGDFLANLRDAQPMQDMGYSLDEVIGKMANLNRMGMNTTDAFKSFEFANDALKKMDANMQQSLSGIGLLPKDIKGKTVKEALEAIDAAMTASNVSVQDKQVLLTQLFGRGGRSMGSAIREGLMSASTPLADLPVVEDVGDKITGMMASVQAWTANVMGSVAIGITSLAPVFSGIGGAVTLMSELTKATWFQNVAIKALTIATRVMNAVAKSGPWGWAALAIGAVSLAVTTLTDKFSWARGIVDAVKNSWKDWGKVVLDFVLMPIKSVIAAVSGLMKLLRGDWSGAVKSFSAPFVQMGNDVKAAANKTVEGYQQGVRNFQSDKYKKAKEETLAKIAAANGVGPSSFTPETLSVVPVAPSGGGGGGSSSGRGGGGTSTSNGGKVLAMTLNIVNNFNGKINSREDIRSLADEVMGVVNDRASDMALAI